MKTAFGIAAFALLLTAIVYWAPRPATIPAELRGKWTTDNPRYADRYLDVGVNLIALSLGSKKISVWFIEQVETLPTKSGKQYVLHMRDEDGELQSLAMQLDPDAGYRMQLGRQHEVVWRRQSSNE